MTAAVEIPLDPNPLETSTNAAVVGAWMLFPTDEERRLRAIRHFEVVAAMERLRVAFPTGAVTVSTEILNYLVDTALDAATKREIDTWMRERAELGIGAGTIIYNACLRIARREASPVTSTTNEVGAALYGHSGDSKHVHEVVRRGFKPVAALWAAWVYLDDGEAGEAAFPCAPDRLGEFLALAEQFRKLAEKSKIARGRPVLEPGSSVLLPDSIVSLLPDSQLLVADPPPA